MSDTLHAVLTTMLADTHSFQGADTATGALVAVPARSHPALADAMLATPAGQALAALVGAAERLDRETGWPRTGTTWAGPTLLLLAAVDALREAVGE